MCHRVLTLSTANCGQPQWLVLLLHVRDMSRDLLSSFTPQNTTPHSLSLTYNLYVKHMSNICQPMSAGKFLKTCQTNLGHDIPMTCKLILSYCPCGRSVIYDSEFALCRPPFFAVALCVLWLLTGLLR